MWHVNCSAGLSCSRRGRCQRQAGAQGLALSPDVSGGRHTAWWQLVAVEQRGDPTSNVRRESYYGQGQGLGSEASRAVSSSTCAIGVTAETRTVGSPDARKAAAMTAGEHQRVPGAQSSACSRAGPGVLSTGEAAAHSVARFHDSP